MGQVRPLPACLSVLTARASATKPALPALCAASAAFARAVAGLSLCCGNPWQRPCKLVCASERRVAMQALPFCKRGAAEPLTCLPACLPPCLLCLSGPASPASSAEHLHLRGPPRNAALPQALLLALSVEQRGRRLRRVCGSGNRVFGRGERCGNAGEAQSLWCNVPLPHGRCCAGCQAGWSGLATAVPAAAVGAIAESTAAGSAAVVVMS